MRKGLVLRAAILVGVLGAPAIPAGELARTEVAAAPGPEAARSVLAQRRAALPLAFVENQGQLDRSVAYYLQGRGTSVYFTARGLVFVLKPGRTGDEAGTASSGRWAVAVDFVGARRTVLPEGEGDRAARVSYFRGPRSEWQTGLRTAAGVVYRDLWPGIDLRYGGAAGRMKYTFVVRPGGDPRRIRFRYRGAASVTVDGSGALAVTTPMGGFRDERPLAYEEWSGGRREVRAEHAVARQGTEFVSRFQLGRHDPSRTLVIDPVILAACGYLGGAGGDTGHAIAVDAAGNAYVTGYSDSDAASFPVAVGPDLGNHGGYDGFVAKVRADGSGLVWAGFVGGAGFDESLGIAVDAAGNAYLAGYTESSEATFPVTVGPDLRYHGGNDAWVAKVRADGSGLDYAGYIGGSASDSARAIAVDAAGRACVTGHTQSTEASFPVAVGPDLSHNGGGDDVFVARVRADGSGLDYCGYLGGGSGEIGYGIALDAAGNAYVAGVTSSPESLGFPVAVGPDLSYNGAQDAFVARVRADGAGLDYAGYLGGAAFDEVLGIAVAPGGSAYLTGYTFSDETSFPAVIGPDLVAGGSGDGFAAKVRADGSGLDYSGFIGGASSDHGAGIALDALGNAYVTGGTTSSEATFPVRGGPGLRYGGAGDAYVAKVLAGGSGFGYLGYIGGAGSDHGGGIAADASGNIHVFGYTTSPEATFPVAVGPDLSHNGGPDAFVARVVEGSCATIAAPIARLLAVASAATPDAIDFSWQADPAANGYNLWYVARKEDIGLARQSSAPPALPVVGCAVPAPASGPSCTDVGALPRAAPSCLFYQARALCDALREGP